MNKDNIPTDATYYTSGEVKKYWKVGLYQTKYYWFVWSKMFSKWIPMYRHYLSVPENLVKIQENV